MFHVFFFTILIDLDDFIFQTIIIILQLKNIISTRPIDAILASKKFDVFKGKVVLAIVYIYTYG